MQEMQWNWKARQRIFKKFDENDERGNFILYLKEFLKHDEFYRFKEKRE